MRVVGAILAILVAGIHVIGISGYSPMYQDEVNGNELPEPPENDTSEVYFTLFTTQGNGVPICADNTSEYLKSVFKSGEQSKFIVHGWLGDEGSDTVNFTAYEYVRLQGGNIVRVDWSYDASWKFYPLSALQVVYIGGVIANLINKLISIQAVERKSLHLIGHSLGAHVMGNAGSFISEGRPARVTGLDPAMPGFEAMLPAGYMLDASDGEFVDVIHSAAGAAGYYQPLGHVDFYPNGGSPPQPGCFDMAQPWQLIGCSHARAYYYYIESIAKPKGFPAIQCDTWNNFKSGACNDNPSTFMGDATPSTARGVYFLETNSHPPYAKG